MCGQHSSGLRATSAVHLIWASDNTWSQHSSLSS